MKVFLAPGVYDVAPEVYHNDPCAEPSLSAGLASELVYATPLHAWASSRRLNPDWEPEDKTQFDIGSACHELLTGKGRGIHVVDAEDFRSKSAQAERDQARTEGFTPLTRPQAEKVQRMIRLARVQMRAHGIGDPFEGGWNEVTLIWKADGITKRAMVDNIDERRKVAYDYKTCAGYAEPTGWVRTSMSHGVDIRAAHYLEGLKATLGGDWTYRFIPQEKKPPHCLSVLQLSESAIAVGQKKARRAAEMWRHCLDTNVWPGFSTEIAIVDPPGFWEANWLERESYEADHKRRTGTDILAAAMAWQAPERTSQ
jgi:hypothetical protein